MVKSYKMQNLGNASTHILQFWCFAMHACMCEFDWSFLCAVVSSDLDVGVYISKKMCAHRISNTMLLN